ncbi:MAG TPA: VOC family protein [Clostridia bacterium]|nr:VOC family protein [Clostridia bacterium]
MYTGSIIFLGTNDLEKTDVFYQKIIGLELIKDQKVCKIYQITEGASIGFCEHIQPTVKEKSPIVTFLCDSVDDTYEILKDKGLTINEAPKTNEKFNIYHFFIEDPNGYTLEFQKFLE